MAAHHRQPFCFNKAHANISPDVVMPTEGATRSSRRPVVLLDIPHIPVLSAARLLSKQITTASEVCRGRRISEHPSVYFAFTAFLAGAAIVGFGFQNSVSSFVQLFGSRLMLGVKTNRFDSVLS